MNKKSVVFDDNFITEALDKLIKAGSRHPEDDDLYNRIDSIRIIVRKQQRLLNEADRIITAASQRAEVIQKLVSQLKSNYINEEEKLNDVCDKIDKIKEENNNGQ